MSDATHRNVLVRALAAGIATVVTVSCFSERAAAPDDPNVGARLCAAAPAANVVQIRNYAFHPAELRVTAGTSVTWVNCDDDIHTSTATGGAWSSGLLARNGTYARRFDAAARFDYRCDPHPFMTAAVVVN